MYARYANYQSAFRIVIVVQFEFSRHNFEQFSWRRGLEILDLDDFDVYVVKTPVHVKNTGIKC